MVGRALHLGGLLVLLAAALGAVPPPGRAAATDRPSAHDEAVAAGRTLVEAGRFEDALAAYGPWGAEMGDELLGRIEAARRQAHHADALALSEAYLRYFPFGGASWREQRAGWGRAAETRLEAAAKVDAAAGEALAQDRAAAELYQRLDRLADDRSRTDPAVQEQVFALADALIAKFPRSRFAAAAALTAALVAEDRPTASGAVHEPGRGLGYLEGYLGKMREAGAAAGDRLPLLYQAARYAESSDDPADRRKALAAWRDILETAPTPPQRRFAMLGAGRAALEAGSPDDLSFARRQFGEFLAAWPAAPEAPDARRGFIRTYLAAGRPEEALAAIREQQAAYPGALGLAEVLLDVAAYHTAAARYPAALAILKEVAGRGAATPAAARAYLAMTDIYSRLGDERHLIEALKAVASLPPAETPDAFLGASDSRDQAAERLAAYYTNKGNWTEALRWWEGLKARTSCPLCRADIEARRAVGIALCLVRLGKTDEALKTLEPMVLDPKGPCPPEAAVLVVDVYRERRQLAAIEARLQEALAKSAANAGARAGLDYVRMVRLADGGDAAALWAILEGHPADGAGLAWQTVQAANLLVSMPAKARAAALERAGRPGTDPMWAATILARLKAPETVALIKEKAAADTRPEALSDYCAALAILGTDEALALLKHYAAEGGDEQKAAARQAMEDRNRIAPAPANRHAAHAAGVR